MKKNMYCQNCGNQIKTELNYCNSCGFRLADETRSGKNISFEHTSTALAFVGVGGIVGFIFLVKILLEKNVDISAVVVILFGFLATIFGICFSIIRLMIKASETSSENLPKNKKMPKTFQTVNTNQLEETKQTPVSVVENTTRTLDKIPVERN